jgi:aryl-alcohol dehydrogenase-like predicted oxidoreductase
MEYRPLGRTGVRVSALCLGTMNFGTRTDLEASCDIIDRALDEGVNFIDTANLYGSGKSEEAVGRALKRDGKRARVVLATKVHFSMDDSDPNASGNTRRHILEQCEASLQRLQTDYIDLYQLHRAQPEVPIDETLRALDDLIRAGKVRYIGTSTFAGWQLVESFWVSKELALNRFVSEQPPYNLLDRRIERELIPMAQTFGIAVLPWSPLGGGLLTGKYKRGQPKPEDSRYHVNRKASDIKNRWNERVFDVVEGLEPIARSKRTSLPKFALAWVLAQPAVTSPIAGPRTMEQLEEYLDATTVKITAADREAVDQVLPPGEHVSPFYEGAFGPHPHRVF